MIRALSSALAATVLAVLPLRAQSLERRIVDAARTGRTLSVQFSFASRAGVCGDGTHFLNDGLGGDNHFYLDGSDRGWRRGEDDVPCVPGPVRVVVWTDDGSVTRLRTYAGPRPNAESDDRADLGTVSVNDATDFLIHLVELDRGSISSDAIVPFVLADSDDPWGQLLRVARNERLSRNVRNTADFWLARGAGFVLGVNGRHESPDDEVRAQAVFALSQQPRESSVPRLIEIVRTSTRPVVRAQALFWLGQSGDPRALELFEDILRRK